jgi:predicted nuclease of predicted toxin-antitoxin system
MRFYLDEDLSHTIAAVAQERFGLDVTTSYECGMNGATDEEQLTFATAEERAIVTNNRDHFLALADRFSEAGTPYSTILITTNLPVHDVGLMARALAHRHALYPEPFIPGMVDYLGMPEDEEEQRVWPCASVGR